MELECEVISARNVSGKTGNKYQTVSLLDRSGYPLEHMIQMSIPEAEVKYPNSDLPGKRVIVKAHKIEQMYGEIRLQGQLELKTSTSGKP